LFYLLNTIARRKMTEERPSCQRRHEKRRFVK